MTPDQWWERLENQKHLRWDDIWELFRDYTLLYEGIIQLQHKLEGQHHEQQQRIAGNPHHPILP